MSAIAVVMMVLFMVAIWGGLAASYVALTRADRAERLAGRAPAARERPAPDGP